MSTNEGHPMDAWIKELAKREPEAAQIIAEREAENARLLTALKEIAEHYELNSEPHAWIMAGIAGEALSEK
jgi:hypothetical protein